MCAKTAPSRGPTGAPSALVGHTPSASPHLDRSRSYVSKEEPYYAIFGTGGPAAHVAFASLFATVLTHRAGSGRNSPVGADVDEKEVGSATALLLRALRRSTDWDELEREAHVAGMRLVRL